MDAARAEPEQSRHVGQPVRVLLADDSEDVRLVLATKLRRDGRFEIVGEAGDGAEAVDLAAALQPDLVLLDLAMPVKDGLQALPRIRQRSPGSKIVVLSGIVADRFVTKALALGAAGYVPKAGDAAILLDTLGRLFPRARAPELEGPYETRGERGSMRGGLAAFLEHEIQRHVRDIIECTAAVRGQATDPDAVRTAASSIERSARQVHEHLARVEALMVDVPLRHESVDLAQLVHELTLDLQLKVQPHPLEVLASGRCVVAGDLSLLRRALAELVTNAAQHTSPTTAIEVTVTARASDVAVVVRDRGDGLPDDIAERALTGDEPPVPTDGYTGLGIAIARNVARAHGGELVFDRPDAGGSRFTLTLPLPRES